MRTKEINFPYGEDPEKNPKWISDRDELFKGNGNGWWVMVGVIKPKPKPKGRPPKQPKQGYRWGKKRGYGDSNAFVRSGFVKKGEQKDEGA